MVLRVNQALCAGCGLCVEACSAGAIQLVRDRAEIDNSLCAQCESCIDVCPNAAISVVLDSAPVIQDVVWPVINTQIKPASLPNVQPTAVQPTAVQPTAVQPTAQPSTPGLASLVSEGLKCLGREIGPRLVDLVFLALERRLTVPASSATTRYSTSQQTRTQVSRGSHKQSRRRRRRAGIRNR